MLALEPAQVDGEAPFELRVDLVEKMLEHDVFGRDRGVGLELEDPMAVLPLQRLERCRDFGDHGIEPTLEKVIAGINQGASHPPSSPSKAFAQAATLTRQSRGTHTGAGLLPIVQGRNSSGYSRVFQSCRVMGGGSVSPHPSRRPLRGLLRMR